MVWNAGNINSTCYGYGMQVAIANNYILYMLWVWNASRYCYTLHAKYMDTIEPPPPPQTLVVSQPLSVYNSLYLLSWFPWKSCRGIVRLDFELVLQYASYDHIAIITLIVARKMAPKSYQV